MLEIEDQLSKYGEALERHLGAGRGDQLSTEGLARRRSSSWLVAVAVSLIAVGSAT